jgi:hypothetical protein
MMYGSMNLDAYVTTKRAKRKRRTTKRKVAKPAPYRTKRMSRTAKAAPRSTYRTKTMTLSQAAETARTPLMTLREAAQPASGYRPPTVYRRRLRKYRRRLRSTAP